MDAGRFVRAYLGLDASTQSLTAVLIGVDGATCRMLGEYSVNYDTDLPAYGTTHGVIRESGGRVLAPARMWAEALEQLIARIVRADPGEASRLAMMSGAAQQHGSVYLTRAGVDALRALDPGGPSLARQLDQPAFARDLSPVWLDASTGADCEALEQAVGGAEVLEAVTGARAFDRFTGPQIRAFHRRDRRGYEATDRIHLVSSFLASLVAGVDAPLEASEASGTNLMDLEQRVWWQEALDATAPDLARRLPLICRSTRVIGAIAPFWQRRYGLPAAGVAAWTGDNPSTLIGSGIVDPGVLSVSLGTSDTVSVFIDRRPAHGGEGYVAASPLGAYLATTTFSNGSLARETVREACGFTWPQVEQLLAETEPGDALALPWYEPEITPRVRVPGLRLQDVAPGDKRARVRAVIEGQMLSLARHTGWMAEAPGLLSATGGASVSRGLLQILADVFNARVIRPRAANTSALGAALRAWHADDNSRGIEMPWPERASAGVDACGGIEEVHPRPDAVDAYKRLRTRHAAFEAAALQRQ